MNLSRINAVDKASALPAVPLEPGTLVENYKIGKVIGLGGFSIVYRAVDLRDDTEVAIKEFYATNCMRRTRDGSLRIYPEVEEHKYHIGIKRFFDEGLTLSQIDHPNIVAVSNFFRHNNTAYLVMSYEIGKDLRWFIKNTDRLPTEEFILSVFSMVLAGLNAVHKNHFLHLDIKPSNILLRANGEPLILDLGAAYKFPARERPTVQTLTHGYSSPEQHQKGELSFSSDLYAIAMTMRACITHQSPFSATDRIDQDDLVPLIDSHAEHYRHNLLKVIDQASHLDPQRRPQSIEEFFTLMTAR